MTALPDIRLRPVVQTWMPGDPVIPGSRWDWDLQQWIPLDSEEE